MPKVSVVVPIYNAGAFLDQALLSLRSQTLNDIEIICLNDGSTDGSLDIIRRHAALDSRIVVVDKQNEGYGATCNRGIDMATAEWVAILEPDDWIEPNAYEAMVDYALLFGQPVDVVKTPYWRIVNPDTDKQMKVMAHIHRDMASAPIMGTLRDMPALIATHPSIWSALYRREFLNEKGIRFLPIPGAGWADNPFMAETLGQANLIVYLDQAYYCYREETNDKYRSFFASQPLVPLERWNQVLDVFERVGMDDPRVLSSHYQRGFANFESVMKFAGVGDPRVDEALSRSFRRMDPELVSRGAYASSTMAKEYERRTGNKLPSDYAARNAAYKARRALRMLSDTNPRNLAKLVSQKLKR